MLYINIAVDLDGVCADFSRKFSEVARQLYGDRCYLLDSSEKIKDWHWAKWYPITENEVQSIWAEIRKTKDFWTTLDVLYKSQWDYFVDKIGKMKNVNVYFIASREQTEGMSIELQSAQWLVSNGWENPFVIASSKKDKFVENLDIKMFIDDKAENLISVKNANPNCIVYAQDVPHNLEKLKISGIKHKRVGGLRKFADDVIDFIGEENYKIKWGKLDI